MRIPGGRLPKATPKAVPASIPIGRAVVPGVLLQSDASFPVRLQPGKLDVFSADSGKL